ncbi:MAG: type II toxin-antitoxin system RelE/ParE family toxin [Gammaproteobacteria bacterium]|nr:type II toxin-antitoxin system RelE/ParE family toxin [Gammaproteobacteria bacterium]
MTELKPVEFRGSSRNDLRAFPVAARCEAGHQLDQVQRGDDPDDWKPMPTVGQGVREIRIQDEAGIFQVIFVAKFPKAVYVLHCFQKKTEPTAKKDLDLAKSRYRVLLKELKPEQGTIRQCSVWDAIEDTSEQAENMKLRSALMIALRKLCKTPLTLPR